MSYNGIGLKSVRGTATSGFVQSNKGHVRASRWRHQTNRNTQRDGPKRPYNPISATARERGNRELQKHDQMRRIENDLMELRETLEDRGSLSEEQIEERIQSQREKLLGGIKREEEERQRRAEARKQAEEEQAKTAAAAATSEEGGNAKGRDKRGEGPSRGGRDWG